MSGSLEAGDGPWILVLDVGSSSARAWLYDGEGRGVDPGPDAQRQYGWDSPEPGAMTVDARRLVDLAAEALDAALEHARAADLQIGAVAVAAFWHSLLGVDSGGSPVTPVLAWGDTRAADAARRLSERGDVAGLHQRTGCFLHPSYPLVKLAWLRRRRPDRFDAVAAWTSFPEFLEWQLLGVRRSSVSMASGSGLLDVHRLRWDAEALDLVGITDAALPEITDEAVRGSSLRADFAARWPELRAVPWYPPLGDGACANVGSGAVGAGRRGVTIGTSAAVRALWTPEAAFRVPSNVWCYRLDARRVVAGGALSNGGNAVASLRSVLRLPEEREWEAEVAAMEPDAHGLTVLPFLVGERGPDWLQQARAAVVGVTRATTPADLLRAWMEALTYQLAGLADALDAAVGESTEVRASGGALHASPIWAQIVADVLGREVVLSSEREAAARGAALVALEGLGRIPALDAHPAPTAARFAPDDERRRRYRAAMQRQSRIEDALRPWTSVAPRP